MWQITTAWYYFQFFMNTKCLQCLVIHSTSILRQNSDCDYIRNSSPYPISYLHIWKRGASDFLHFSGIEYDWNLAKPTYPWGILTFEFFLQRPVIWRNVFNPVVGQSHISSRFLPIFKLPWAENTPEAPISKFCHCLPFPEHYPSTVQNSCK